VLPFTNLGGDPQQEYFSDGISDQLITDLSQLPDLFVIARRSSFAYKGRNEPVQQIATELGAKYLLEGSVRRSGGRLRIHVQLVDATRGNQVWAHRYDKQLGDVFAIQDEIVQSVVATLGVKFTALRKGMVIPQYTKSDEAYNYYSRGVEQLFIADSYPQAIEMFEKAVAADPGYSDAYASLALANQIEYFWQFAGDPDTPEKSETLARKAIALDESNGYAFGILAVALAFENRPGEALAAARRAVALDGNDPNALIAMSAIFNVVKQPDEALSFAQKTLRLVPTHPENILFQVGFAYDEIGRYREAIEAFKQSDPNNAWVHLGLIYSYMELGYEREARIEAREVMRIAPKFSLEMAQRRLPGYFDDVAGQHYLDNLRHAGLK
jgi:TolB-like protein/predicted Zn-dependent protease